MSRRPARSGLFTGWWYTPDLRKKARRIRRDEYPELYRLWRKHTAIRLGIAPVGMRAPWTLSTVAGMVPGEIPGRIEAQAFHRETPAAAENVYGNLHPGTA